MAKAFCAWTARDLVASVVAAEHLDHWKSTKTRAQVMAEVEAARKDGTLALMQRNAPLPIKATGPGKTRQQVIAEMLNESPEQRRARMELQSGG
jgi:hypothetical protein